MMLTKAEIKTYRDWVEQDWLYGQSPQATRDNVPINVLDILDTVDALRAVAEAARRVYACRQEPEEPKAMDKLGDALYDLETPTAATESGNTAREGKKPPIESLAGSVPDCTGEMTTAEFIDSVRGECASTLVPLSEEEEI